MICFIKLKISVPSFFIFKDESLLSLEFWFKSIGFENGVKDNFEAEGDC